MASSIIIVVLALSLIVPLLLVHAAAWWLTRSLSLMDDDARARRHQWMAWLIPIAFLAQIILSGLLLQSRPDQLRSLVMDLQPLFELFLWLAKTFGLWFPSVAGLILLLIVLSADYVLFHLAYIHVSNRLKQVQGSLATHAKASFRSTISQQLPMLVWMAAFFSLPASWYADLTSLMFVLTGFLFLIYALGPFFTGLSQPTDSLPAGHPARLIATELARLSNVQVTDVRLIRYGEQQVANAMISGILPVYRHIFISNTLLEELSDQELRAVLAHEIGHVKHGHLWWYLLFGVCGGVVLPLWSRAIASIPGLDNQLVSSLLGIGLYFGSIYAFFSRRFEYQADRFALTLTHDVAHITSALEKLANLNVFSPRRSVMDIISTHPSVESRIAALTGT